MEWTDIRLTVAKADADNAEAVATMIAEGGIYIEDYSDKMCIRDRSRCAESCLLPGSHQVLRSLLLLFSGYTGNLFWTDQDRWRCV